MRAKQREVESVTPPSALRQYAATLICAVILVPMFFVGLGELPIDFDFYGAKFTWALGVGGCVVLAVTTYYGPGLVRAGTREALAVFRDRKRDPTMFWWIVASLVAGTMLVALLLWGALPGA